MRIVSLVPSSTETLLDLGADVVACTRFCEQPHLAHVGGTKNPDISAIVALAPDLVVLDREENRLEDHDALLTAGLNVFVSDVRTVDQGVQVVDDLAAAAGGVVAARSVPPAPAVGALRRTAFVPIWRRPWMTIGPRTYGASVLDRLGVDLLAIGDESDYPTVELDVVAAARPDLVLVPSEPYDFTDAHIAELNEALPAALVVRIDGQDLFWWGSRTVPALGRLAEVLARLPAG